MNVDQMLRKRPKLEKMNKLHFKPTRKQIPDEPGFLLLEKKSFSRTKSINVLFVKQRIKKSHFLAADSFTGVEGCVQLLEL